MSNASVKKDINHDSAMRQRVEINGHELFFDVDSKHGGANSAPDPHDYVDAALIACKALTIRMVAKHKNMPLEDVIITLDSDASKERKGLYRMAVSIELIGELTQEQRQALFDVAEKCPIGRLLSDEVTIEITSKLV